MHFFKAFIKNLEPKKQYRKYKGYFFLTFLEIIGAILKLAGTITGIISISAIPEEWYIGAFIILFSLIFGSLFQTIAEITVRRKNKSP
jgi:hypothetical protein